MVRATIGRVLLFGIATSALLAPAARATCFGERFGQISPDSGYFYVHFPASWSTTDSIVGRLWSPGDRAHTGEGQCDESFWLLPCDPSVYPCGGGQAGHVYYVMGDYGTMACAPAGCPANELIALLQDINQSSAYFAVGRVDRTPERYLTFDYARLGQDWTLREIPRPNVTSSQKVGNDVILNLSFNDPAPGFFGLPGQPATSTITAFHLYEFRESCGVSLPGRNRDEWTFVQRYPYLGGQTTGAYTINCAGDYVTHLATALELDGGQFVTDYVSRTVEANCGLQSLFGVGRVDDRGTPLRVSKAGGGDLTLTWGNACSYGGDFEVYEGILGDFASHTPRFCTTAGAHEITFTPAEGDSYYVIVPYGEDVFPPMQWEGSYGLRGDGTERPVGTSWCRPQKLCACSP